MKKKEVPDRNLVTEVAQVVSDFLCLNPNLVSQFSGLGHLEGWDSLHHLKIILAVEKHFDIQFDNAQLVELDTVEKIVNAISVLKYG